MESHQATVIRIEAPLHLLWDLQGRLHRIESLLETLVGRTAGMSQELDRLQQEVTNNNNVVQSAITLIRGLADQISNAADDPAALQALVDTLHAQDQVLADAVAANTQPAGGAATANQLAPGSPEPGAPLPGGAGGTAYVGGAGNIPVGTAASTTRSVPAGGPDTPGAGTTAGGPTSTPGQDTSNVPSSQQLPPAEQSETTEQ